MEQHRFSYRNLPTLQYIQGNLLSKSVLFEQDRELPNSNWSIAVQSWIENHSFFAEDIKYVAPKYFEAINANYNKILAAAVDVINDMPDFAGTIIFGDRELCFRYQKIGDGMFLFTYFIFQKGTLVVYKAESYKNKTFSGFISSVILNNKQVSDKNNVTNLELYGTDIIVIYAFIKFNKKAETIFLAPKKKTKSINCKYLNETDLKITVIGSDWFNNLVQSNAFMVNPHLRFQPCGVGRKDRKLIWIGAYMKQGYTKEAGMLKES